MSERPSASYLRRLSEHLAAQQFTEALAVSAEAASLFPDDEPVLRARAVVLRRAGLIAEATEFLSAVLAGKPNAAWAHAQAGAALQHRESARALEHYRRALEIEPGSHDYRVALIHSLARTGDGDELDEAYRLLRPVLPGAGGWAQNDIYIAYDVLRRVCAYDELEALGEPLVLGRKWAEAGHHTALLLLLNQATTPERRNALAALHRIAVRRMEAAAAADPLWLPEDVTDA